MADIPAQPYSFSFDPARAGLLIIDMQRDFLEPSGFGAALGNDVGRLRAAIDPTRILLQAARNFGLCVIHTREGHLPDLSDLPGTKHRRGRFATRIGDAGPMGRLLVRGEAGNAIIPELAPLAGETVIDKPGKGAFYATDLEGVLHRNRISQLLICGVTTEVCVASTVREANDRGFDCLVLQDCTASYFPEFHEQTLRMMTAQDGIFGWVAESLHVLRVIDRRADFLSAPSVTPAGTGG